MFNENCDQAKQNCSIVCRRVLQIAHHAPAQFDGKHTDIRPQTRPGKKSSK